MCVCRFYPDVHDECRVLSKRGVLASLFDLVWASCWCCSLQDCFAAFFFLSWSVCFKFQFSILKGLPGIVLYFGASEANLSHHSTCLEKKLKESSMMNITLMPKDPVAVADKNPCCNFEFLNLCRTNISGQEHITAHFFNDTIIITYINNNPFKANIELLDQGKPNQSTPVAPLVLDSNRIGAWPGASQRIFPRQQWMAQRLGCLCVSRWEPWNSWDRFGGFGTRMFSTVPPLAWPQETRIRFY